MMTQTLKISLNKPFDKQRAILTDKTRFRVLAIGRRWGKTEVLKISMVNRLLRGENIWFCSPTHKNNKRVFPQVVSLLRQFPEVYINKSDLLIRLPLTGGKLEFISLENPDNVRGEGLNHLYIDEAAFIRQGVFDTVLRPMLVTSQGGATLASSPNGTGNDFHSMYARGLDPLATEWVSYHEPSSSSPFVPNSELEDIKRNTPERVFQQEYLALFLDDGGAVFRNMANCVVESPKREGGVVFGVDWGKDNDFTVITAIDRSTGHVLEIDRFNQIGWSLQRSRLMAMAERHKPLYILAEENSIGSPNIEALQREGLPVRPFQTTGKSKPPLIEGLALALERQDIGIPNDPVLLGELQAYTLKRTPSGNYQYSAPDGLHDDMVMSLALSWYALNNSRTSFFI
jgi:hypothetical protein